MGAPVVFGTGALTYSWLPPAAEPPAPITHYNLMLVPDSGLPLNVQVPAETRSTTVEGLVTYMSYRGYVQASCDGGATWSLPAAYPVAYAFSAPEGYLDAAWAWRETPTSIEVHWRHGLLKREGIRPYFYVAGRSKDPADPRVGYATPDIFDKSCVISGLNPSSVYIFSVCYVNEAGRSAKARTNNVYPLDGE
jgi:hypothetical protein